MPENESFVNRGKETTKIVYPKPGGLMAVDITNHLIPYTQVKRMLANAWDEGRAAERNYTTAFDNWREHITDHRPDPPTNPYRENK